MDFMIPLLFSVVYGWVEQRIYRRGFTSEHTILNHFGRYHIGMLILFTLVAFPRIILLPLMVVLEDMSFFVFHPTKELNKQSWVNWHFGGISCWGIWIPFVYVYLILVYLILESIF